MNINKFTQKSIQAVNDLGKSHMNMETRRLRRNTFSIVF